MAAKKKTVKKGGKKKAAKAGAKAKSKAKAKAKGAKPKAPKKPKKKPKKKAAKTPAKKAATTKSTKPVAAKKAAKARPAATKRAASETRQAPPAGKVLAMSINLGHIFALRPRVETSFRPIHLQQAKHQLASEVFDSIEDAARAVADKALESTHEGSNRGAFKSRRR